MIQHVVDWRPLWPWVRGGLDGIVAKTNPTWIPEDVYAELKGGTASLFTVGDRAAFFIAKRITDYDGLTFFVWVIWGPGECVDIWRDVLGDIEAFAKRAGCRHIRMMSPRRGWSRVGWVERDTIYERALT
jgi:hypothetical protein